MALRQVDLIVIIVLIINITIIGYEYMKPAADKQTYDKILTSVALMISVAGIAFMSFYTYNL